MSDKRRTQCCFTLKSEPHAEGCWASAAAPGSYGRAPPDIIETMNVAREAASGRAVGCTEQQLVALGYRALSLDLQVAKDVESINSLRAALAEALDGWESWLREDRGQGEMPPNTEESAHVARIAELRAKFLKP